jgi:aryl-alcohol dehydrogenase-like predicted oxidoreductase
VTPAALPRRRLGGLDAPAIGYGAMELGGAYHPPADLDDAVRALRAAVDAGCTFVDTADTYGPSERQIGALLAAGVPRAHVQISTKFGLRPFPDAPTRDLPVPYGAGTFAIDASPERVRQYVERSLERLGTDTLDLCSPHFPDPGVPIEDTVGALADVQAAGLVVHLGLSNPTLGDLVRAQAIATIDAVQVEWSMWHPIDAALLARCASTGVGVVAYAPVGRGFLTGAVHRVEPSDFRATIERFAGAHLTTNHDRYAPVRALAAELGLSPAQLALAWLLHQSPTVVPIPGSRSPEHISENAAAAGRALDPETLARVDATLAAITPSGAVS